MLAALGLRHHLRVATSHGRSFSLLHQSTATLKAEMKKYKQHRAYLCFDRESGKIKTSHEMFDEIASTLAKDSRDYHEHEGIFLAIGASSDHLLSAVVHKSSRGPGAGGVRFWGYNTTYDFIRDGLRLAEGMGRKNALAGLWWGGGKGVIAREQDWTKREVRDKVFADYGDFMTSLQGCYVTAEDLGATVDDMSVIFGRTRFTTCIPQHFGGSGNPSTPTGIGVACAIEAALAFLGKGTVAGKSFAIQGAGNVSTSLVTRLLALNAGKIMVSDVNPDHLSRFEQQFGSRVTLKHADPEMSILFEDVDVVCPCAVGGILNPKTIPRIRARLVVGAANNQLLNDTSDDRLLVEHGITYVPDFLANRMGIVNCANEQYGNLTPDPAIERHFGREWPNSIWQKVHEILGRAQQKNETSAQAAIRVADELSKEDHPIWPNRSRQIIKDLMDHQWHLQGAK